MRKGELLMAGLVLGGLLLWASSDDDGDAVSSAPSSTQKQIAALPPEQLASLKQRAAQSGQSVEAVYKKDKRRAM